MVRHDVVHFRTRGPVAPRVFTEFVITDRTPCAGDRYSVLPSGTFSCQQL